MSTKMKKMNNKAEKYFSTSKNSGDNNV
jgi:hypothetical protein